MATYFHALDSYVCRFHKNASALLQSMSAFFSRDNVGLAGIAHYFKASDALTVGVTCSVAWCCNVCSAGGGTLVLSRLSRPLVFSICKLCQSLS